MKNRLEIRIAAVGLAAILFISISGCNRPNSSGLTPSQTAAANRMDEIANRTGGDWNKATPDDKAYLMKQAFGDERAARMLLYSRIDHSNSSPFGNGGRPATQAAPNTK